MTSSKVSRMMATPNGVYAVVMAGGSGSRFWPLSREQKPKQFLSLPGTSETLLQATVRRVSACVSPQNVLVVTTNALAALVAEQLPLLPRENILVEPAPRSTAACIGWPAAWIRRRDALARVVVLPSD